MTTSWIVRARAFVFAAIAIVAIAAATPASAQRCPCDYVSVYVEPGVACSITLYPSAPLCRYTTVTVTPGQLTQIACCDDMQIELRGPNGAIVFALGNPLCYYNFNAGAGCCIDACISIGKGGCPFLHISPAAGPC